MIALSAIEKSFGGNAVLRGIDLAVPEGRVTALIGPSGSGKSTLLRCVNLLEMPRSGTLDLGDIRLTFRPDRPPTRREMLAVRRQTGMVFQNFQLFPHRTVLENVTEGLVTVAKWPQARARARALELLERVGLAHKAGDWPANLSGGQQQRVAIARALAPSPRLLLCDEPTSALDPELAAEVVDVLASLAGEGMTMLMATHDLRLARRVADTVVFLEGGTIVERGPAPDLFAHPKDPRTRRFIRTLLGEAAEEA
ncbi:MULTISPECIES: amino acid ABC transporter ATP-binding protein [Methylobacterium]|jgi:cystine transport system ATP-binding protein|uniref:Amino acid ABC transporter ATP-binding protein, PAAT family n=1 Tax=Methylobacterium phyllosphaerae TaxID=418223 RepID=A0AAE8HQM5_9HYPH|nr:MULTISPECIES: amino acid ABC transporter ATP-binding protein [Methylobacterium]APT33650.1 methionine import ATP-binding protein MetN [Methylobacterium phyllosphaerae]SFG72662.1 amino acid ABC transporter ATP-binding protein, PAAT family [Methylobacterium phyllosphaerae]SFU98601.1 cystine transport system ATP-binding protein [Methylobacterium sp. UNCCL125]